MGGKYLTQPRSKTMQDISLVPFSFHVIVSTKVNGCQRYLLSHKTDKAALFPLEMQEAAA
jgi:hypothetical protein